MAMVSIKCEPVHFLAVLWVHVFFLAYLQNRFRGLTNQSTIFIEKKRDGRTKRDEEELERNK